jgi:hypothetical protein
MADATVRVGYLVIPSLPRRSTTHRGLGRFLRIILLLPHLPLPKGSRMLSGLFGKPGGRGGFIINVHSIMRLLIIALFFI